MTNTTLKPVVGVPIPIQFQCQWRSKSSSTRHLSGPVPSFLNLKRFKPLLSLKCTAFLNWNVIAPVRPDFDTYLRLQLNKMLEEPPIPIPLTPYQLLRNKLLICINKLLIHINKLLVNSLSAIITLPPDFRHFSNSSLLSLFENPFIALALFYSGVRQMQFSPCLLGQAGSPPSFMLQKEPLIRRAIQCIGYCAIQHLFYLYLLKNKLAKPKQKSKEAKNMDIQPNNDPNEMRVNKVDIIFLSALRNPMIALAFLGPLLLIPHLLSPWATSPGRMGGYCSLPPSFCEITSVLKLQVGILCTTRTIQRDLNRLAAESVLIFPCWSLYPLLAESVCALLRHPADYFVSAYSQADTKGNTKAGYAYFCQSSIEEQEKFDGKPVLNILDVKGRRRPTSPGAAEFNEYLVVTILMGVGGVHNLPSIKGFRDLMDALYILVRIPPRLIRGVEILWTEKEHLEDYPLLKPL